MSNKNFQLNKGHRQFDVSKKKRTFDLEKDPEFVDEVIKDSDATVIPVVPVVQNDVQSVPGAKAAQTPAKSSDATAPASGAKAAQTSAKASDETVQPVPGAKAAQTPAMSSDATAPASGAKAAQTSAKSSDATAPASGAKAAQTSAKPSDEKVQPAKKIKNFLLAGLAIAATVLLFVFLFTGNDVESEQPGTNLISEQNGGGTNDPAVSGTNDPAVSGTNDPVVSGTNGSAVSGTSDPAVSGTNGSVVSGINDSGAVKPGNATLSDTYIEEKAKLVIRGDFGNGAERKRRLGAEYKAIQKKVNEMYAKGLVY